MLTSPVEALAKLFGFAERPNLEPRYNVAPGQDVAVVRLGEDGARHLAFLHWGLVPFWAEDKKIAYKMINARAESAAEKPAFRAAFRHRRCLIPADGFYEWLKLDGGAKQPYWIRPEDGAPFAFAGLWEHWQDEKSGEDLESCTILTTEAAASIAAIHPRMPVMLPPERFSAWLDPEAEKAELGGLLSPYEGALTASAVSRRVNKPANDDPDVLRPETGGDTEDAAAEGEAGSGQGQLF